MPNSATWIQKDFKFPDFAKTLEFVNKVGQIAEEKGHHPDIYFTWANAKFASKPTKSTVCMKMILFWQAKLMRSAVNISQFYKNI